MAQEIKQEPVKEPVKTKEKDNVLYVKSKVQDFVSSQGLRLSSKVIDLDNGTSPLDEAIKALLLSACKRAKIEGMKTLMEQHI